ncbi:hypothetical protein B0H13DRAFT_2446201 [Mycena leptocephala]|nr:hypothetical protein B0H13DRAFT_2446201 [Mycena leptocephala]
MAQRTGILDLPTEILVTILDRSIVSIHSLRSLAVLCRRLQFIALPIYFSRHGLTPTSKSVVINMTSNRRDLLAVLQMALFIPETENITCIFSHPSCVSIFPVLRHLKRLQTYISRLLSVNDVTLIMDDVDSACLSFGNNDRALRAWTKRSEDLPSLRNNAHLLR